MIERIYSKIRANLILHTILRGEYINSERTDVSNAEENLQIATMALTTGKTFRPHKHIRTKHWENMHFAQETWIVIKGTVKAILYDLDDKVIGEYILNAGDCSITYEGGHTYEVLESAIVYEVKNGPYLGREKDKVFI